MTRVKICGMTRLEDALHACACGADMLGFNFYQRSPRFIAPEAARAIVAALPSNVEAVGVFVNAAADEIRQIASFLGLNAVQLHGDESPEYCAALTDLNVIKALRIASVDDVQHAAQYGGCRILLDSPSAQFGGSGRQLDLALAAQVRHSLPRATELILAGGLDAANVAEAIARVQPDAVDACSRLESSPGIKDPGKVQKFIAAVHAAARVRAVNTAAAAAAEEKH